MNKKILETLKKIEKEQNITILYACESGSRAWNMNTSFSDFDVRFIYKREMNWYLQLIEGKNTFEYSTKDNEEYVGWDIKKALQLLLKSNPTLLEWIYSPIIYHNHPSFRKEIRKLSKLSFSPVSVLHHYLSMAKRNHHSLFETNKSKTKLYLNVIKPIACCMWIVNHHEFPEIGKEWIFEECSKDRSVRTEINRLIDCKKNDQHDFHSEILDDYIHSSLESLDQVKKEFQTLKTILHDPFNEFFVTLIQEK
ncbi:nucleotidyltransferase domain-containing protein [Metabacillus litoralis]|uniref:nucleotidyltransferase domain-containing protein n=1 Tax=Metabacillus TaxID=2675233 RepID=UPI001B9FD5CC|nr:nucleotidyltransferase domain-containing protein [Metabacillus litoralis]MCM3160125.1 nucleotidyltransferase domain-containing protein [Metabacillus litoralis]MCM3408710.1 nucleotidyltransferase domain-containing protein [Metabacillus litoralis]UHA59628.1 nucleotidyltransferase domain-containing protein [Metabacillus litoralis]